MYEDRTDRRRKLAPWNGRRPGVVVALLALACLGAPAAHAKGRKAAPKPAAQTQQTPKPPSPDSPSPTSGPTKTPASMQNSQQAESPAAQLPTTPTNELTASAPLIHFQDVPTTRVGIDPNNTVRLTLHDAVVMAVARNLGIEVSRFDVTSSEYNLF